MRLGQARHGVERPDNGDSDAHDASDVVLAQAVVWVVAIGDGDVDDASIGGIGEFGFGAFQLQQWWRHCDAPHELVAGWVWFLRAIQRKQLMERLRVEPRPEWATIVEGQGRTYPSPEGQAYG